MTEPKVVIIGGGFGGLQAAKSLAHQPVRVTLVDKKNHHNFQPLLYQVALAVLAPGEICHPLRNILRKYPNIQTFLGEAIDIDPQTKEVVLKDDIRLSYDYLIVAAGARHSYFGNEDWEAVAPGLKTLEDAVEIRRRLLLAFEKAEREAILTGEAKAPEFAVIGGGPTGVEVAGAIADLAKLSLAKDFKAIDTRQSKVRLFEGADRLLGTYTKESSASAQRQLAELGVEVLTGSLITAVEPGRVRAGERWYQADVTVWATGVAASPLGRCLAAGKTDRAGRVPVNSDLSLVDHPEVFVIGDMSLIKDADGNPVPGLAAAAQQEGKAAASNILRDLKGQKRKDFHYQNRGVMATIGHNRAVAEIGGRRFTGLVAWLLWSSIHVMLLISFRNRLAVMREWIWAYIRKQGSSPLITDYHKSGSDPEKVSEPKQHASASVSK